MKYFDKRMTLDLIADALTTTDTPYDRGVMYGLCGAFYMCGLLNDKEWAEFLKKCIPSESHKDTDNEVRWINNTH